MTPEPLWLAAAIETGREATHPAYGQPSHHYAELAILAVLPIVRAGLAQEIRDDAERTILRDALEHGPAYWNGLEDGYEAAARIVEGNTDD